MEAAAAKQASKREMQGSQTIFRKIMTEEQCNSCKHKNDRCADIAMLLYASKPKLNCGDYEK